MTSATGDCLIFKITTGQSWAEACATGSFQGSADDTRDGFIHLSARAQLTGTANKYFSQQLGLVVVAFRASDLSDHLLWEASRGGDHFPHYYGALPAGAACWIAALPLDDHGQPCVDETLKALPAGL